MEIKNQVIDRLDNPNIVAEVSKIAAAGWFYAICSKSEIERIKDPQNGDDFILLLRADIIADNMRLYRVVKHYVDIAERSGVEWSLEEFYKTDHFEYFKNHLPVDLKEKVDGIATGLIFTKEANGLIFKTDFGFCSVLSASLFYFIKFSFLALIDSGGRIPPEVCVASLRIAIRTMFEKEALDFDWDPRGIIPEDIEKVITAPYPYIMTFLAGHEYSHFLNGDLDDYHAVQKTISTYFKDGEDYKKIGAYNSNQKQEFAADLGALTYPKFDDEEYNLYYYYALSWFAILAIFEAAENTMFPPFNKQSHPGAKARYNNILNNAKRPSNFEEMKVFYMIDLPRLVSDYEEIIIEDVQYNYEGYEFEGSVYLAAPNTEWRGPELIDRVDY